MFQYVFVFVLRHPINPQFQSEIPSKPPSSLLLLFVSSRRRVVLTTLPAKAPVVKMHEEFAYYVCMKYTIYCVYIYDISLYYAWTWIWLIRTKDIVGGFLISDCVPCIRSTGMDITAWPSTEFLSGCHSLRHSCGALKQFTSNCEQLHHLHQQIYLRLGGHVAV